MSLYGKAITVNGLVCGIVRRGQGNGKYELVFERDYAGPKQIEAIDWSCPEIEGDSILPAGHGFVLEDISYRHSDRCYVAALAVAGQYLGDVTGYQAQVEALQGELDAAEGQVSELTERAESASQTVTALVGASITPQRAMELRSVIETAAVSLPDADAAKAVELFPAWAYPVDYAVGDRVNDGGRLHKCQQAHTSQEGWNPGATPALWVAIDVDHAGTVDDPIPAARGMEYEYGKYYLDGEDGKTYLCERTGETAGGKVVLQYLPHELTGQYFTAA